LYCQL